MATSDAPTEYERVDTATLESPMSPVKVKRSILGTMWYIMRRYPVLPGAVLVILIIA